MLFTVTCILVTPDANEQNLTPNLNDRMLNINKDFQLSSFHKSKWEYSPEKVAH